MLWKCKISENLILILLCWPILCYHTIDQVQLLITRTMSALKFLSKKSWHTGLIKNNEKVWLREKADAEEKKRVAELQKQLEEERRVEEIQRLEIESGRLDPSEVKRRQRIEWMYEDVENAHTRIAKEKKAKEQEEMLLGKKAASLPSGGSKDKDPEKLRLTDAENKLREDPLFAIEQERRKVMGALHVDATADRKLSRERHAKLAAKLARKAERREIREGRKRRREEREYAKLQNVPTPSNIKEKNDRYGLLIPQGGSNVRVKERFVPKESNTDNHVRKRHRTTSYAPVESKFSNSRNLDPSEKLKEMERAAEELYRSRHERVRARDTREELEAREEENDRLYTARNSVVSKFAYDALTSRNDSIGDRIRQKGRNN